MCDVNWIDILVLNETEVKRLVDGERFEQVEDLYPYICRNVAHRYLT